MRADSLGMFWFDEPPKPKEKKEKLKCVPPFPTWEAETYLPGLREAMEFNVPLMTMADLMAAMNNREELLFDCEVYRNYFLAAFRSFKTGKVIFYEMTNNTSLDMAGLSHVIKNFCTVGFFSNNYDLTVTALALAGKTCSEIKDVSDQLIVEKARPSDILKSHKVKRLLVNHIDLIEVAPLRGGLKTYGGRMHIPRMQDLPFKPNRILSAEQIAIVRWYCINDLTATGYLRASLQEELDLRIQMSEQYDIDLRSRSDAQIAEAVIGHELEKLRGSRIYKPVIPVGTSYRYNLPVFLRFNSQVMQWVTNLITQLYFFIDETGSIATPPELLNLKIPLGTSTYTIGIGGLHSCEKKICHIAGPDEEITDTDAVSFYPFIILNLGLYPQHLGPDFLFVYKGIVYRRIDAKKAKNKKVANSLKIVINGSYGKLGSKYSIFYAPDLLIQTTITGQLSLLMLIERMEMAGISVISANTDGIVTKCHRSMWDIRDSIIAQWERDTRFETESVKYLGLFSRDVNNYFAVKAPCKDEPEVTIKSKGAYSRPGLSKNPTNEICIDAIENLFTKGIPIAQTITTSRDLRKFITMRNVNGLKGGTQGAVKLWPDQEHEFLGKSVRWYYSNTCDGIMVYAGSGKKVPGSDGARPIMDMPLYFPKDIDYDRYIAITEKMLKEVGYL